MLLNLINDLKIKNFKNSALVLVLLASCNSNQSSDKEITPENGDLNKSFVEQASKVESLPEEKVRHDKEKLIAEGWQEQDIQNGQFPACYNFKPQKEDVDNYLDVYVGSGTDVAIKVMNLKTEKCFRYIFINSGSSYKIKNIPEGIYCLKLAYGKDWLSKVSNGQCIGKFIRNAMYRKGEDTLDFRNQHSKVGYSIPSFKLQLDVISNNISSTFSSQNISESEFNQ